MTDDIFWQLFKDTGDPMSYLMYKASDSGKNPPADDTKRTLGTGNLPAARG